MSTYFPKGEIARKWFVIDADGQTLGRLATRVARILSGKDSPKYTPFLDTGDHVIVINADKMRITGLKADAKVYHHYSGYPGGMKSEEYKKRHGAQARADRGRGYHRHAAAYQAGPRDGRQAEGLSRRQASARRAEAGSPMPQAGSSVAKRAFCSVSSRIGQAVTGAKRRRRETASPARAQRNAGYGAN